MAERGSDVVTLVDLTDGVSVVLSSESYSFPGSASAAIAGSTTTKIQALLGSEYVAASVNTNNITKPSNVTVVSDNHATSPTLTISVTTSVTAAGEISIPVQVGELTITKKFSFSIAFKGGNGSNGVSATSVGLKNEAISIPTTSAGLTTSALSVDIDFYGYIGSTRAAATAAIPSLPSWLTIATNTAGTASADGVLRLTVANANNLGNVDFGVVLINIVCNSITFPVFLSWSKAKAGSNGSNGADAITLQVISSNGLLFKNTLADTVLTAKVYRGGVELNAAAITPLGTVKWYKDEVYLTGKDGLTLTIAPGDVLDRASYTAKLEY